MADTPTFAQLDPESAAARAAIFDALLRTGRAPALAELAERSGLEVGRARDALHRLAQTHVVVLQPGADAIWMAMPFSALPPTAFRVSAERSDGTAGAWWANCAWDALGIAAMLAGAGLAAARSPIRVETTCPDCDRPLALTVRADAPSAEQAVRRDDPDADGSPEPVVHFAVPAARWWDDIGFT